MKVLVSCLQVSQGGSKGHLHPALEIALELRRRGHKPVLLPLPSPLGDEDQRQLKATGIPFIIAPELPRGVLKTPGELARLAASQSRVHEAYRSFLVSPLEHQYKRVRALIKKLDVRVVAYDLLSYAPALAARSLGIPDVGFCAGLKLAAPGSLQKFYRRVRERLRPEMDRFLSAHGIQADFHHLELLSSHAQLVFGSEVLLGTKAGIPPRTRVIGPLRPSLKRGDGEGLRIKTPGLPFGLLCFGSVQDPADFPHVTDKIMRVSESLGLPIIISSKKLHSRQLPAHATAFPYLPLPRLLQKASVLFHHGGANTFSEAFFSGIPQILIPLATDQPIQAEILKNSGAGFSFAPDSLNEAALRAALKRCLNPSDPIHKPIAQYAQQFRRSRGAEAAAQIIEEAGLKKASVRF